MGCLVTRFKLSSVIGVVFVVAGSGEELQWYFSQVKGANEEEINEGNNPVDTSHCDLGAIQHGRLSLTVYVSS